MHYIDLNLSYQFYLLYLLIFNLFAIKQIIKLKKYCNVWLLIDNCLSIECEKISRPEHKYIRQTF